MYRLFSFFLLFSLMNVLPASASDFFLDPGHSPAHPGAQSCSGQFEFRYNEALAQTVLAYLQERGIVAELTLGPGKELSLKARAQKASGSKLLISLHHDSAQEQYIDRSSGFPCSTHARGFAIFVSAKNPFFEESLLYARILGEILTTMGLRPSTHHGEPIKGENRERLDAGRGIYRFDDLIVLKEARVPAMLLEAAVIIHPEDDHLAKTRSFRQLIAEAITQTLRFVLASLH